MPNRTQKANILVVDDKADSLLAIEAILCELNQNIILANSAKQALKHALKLNFAVILMDAHMPIMDGFETARLIRSRAQSAHTPIIFMTALYKNETDITQGYALGAVDYIFKPINPLILLSKVKVFVELYKKAQQNVMLENELQRRLQVERELKLLTQRTSLILNSVGEGIFGLNLKGRITFANPAAAKILGKNLLDLIDQSVQTILPKHISSWKLTPLYQALKKNETYHMQLTFFKNKEEKEIPIEYTVAPLHNASRHRQGLVVLFKDITERNRTEMIERQQHHQMQIAKGSQMSSMIEMASALAHELNQPLATIANYTQGSIRRLEASSPDIPAVLNAMRKAADQSHRAGEIIHRIKGFVRKGKLYLQEADINQVIKSAVALMEYELKEHKFTIHYELAKKIPLIELDKIQIEQVIINLVRNSIEAMSEANIANPTISINTQTCEKNTVEINIIDNGPGFPQEFLQQLPNTYFTTKTYGMGMGLSICRTIVEAHGGYIQTKQLLTHGAWIQFTLHHTKEKLYV